MKRFFMSMTMLAVGALMCVGSSSAFAAEKGGASGASAEEQAKLVNEGELAQWLVRVLGLSRFLPASPTDLDCFAILMQNNIMPRDGWSQERTVTMGNLARVVVLALGKQSEVENQDNDESWVDYLKSSGIDFGTIGEAIDNLEPLPQPVGHEAIVISTDPLSKLSRINPPDNQQLGADLSTFGRISSRIIRRTDLPHIEQIIRRPGTAPRPPPMTPTTGGHPGVI
ncbi:MAG: hypothetical protein M5U15_09225 [Kiritimatiellae bacterium]|nr:hypothetical protein [Kiritimatiellia bacterium]